MSEELFENLDEVIEQVDAEIVDNVSSVISNLTLFEKTIRALYENDEYKPSQLDRLMRINADALNIAKDLKLKINDFKTKAKHLELEASIKRNPTNTDPDEEE